MKAMLWVIAIAAIPALAVFIGDVLIRARIRRWCRENGVVLKRIRTYPNHFGVDYLEAGKSRYAKCVWRKGGLEWLGSPPPRQVSS